MTETIIVGILSLAGTLAGTLGGILASNKLTNYRISQLEDKVSKHNNLIERTYHIEEELAVYDEKMRVANHRIDDLEDYHKGDHKCI